MNKFLIINPFGIGDLLFTTPVAGAIKARYPHSLIGYWCNERARVVLKGNFNVDKIFGMSRGDIKRRYEKSPLKRFFALIKLIWRIRREKFDVAFDFSLDSRYGFWSKLAGIKRRIGFDYKERGRFLTDKVKLSGYSGKHVVAHNLDLLKYVGIEPVSRPLELPVSENARVEAKKMLSRVGVKPSDMVIGIAMGGGASWGRDAIYKQWPAKNFAQVAEKLIKEKGARIVLLGSAEEKPIAEIMGKMELSCPRKRASINDAFLDSRFRGNDKELNQTTVCDIVNLTGRLNLEELAAVMKELKLLICNDGGPLHMAVALGVKTVSIFGPVDEKVYGPYPQSEAHVVVKKDMPCRPCYKNFRFPGCFNDKACLEKITVDEVYEKVKRLL